MVNKKGELTMKNLKKTLAAILAAAMLVALIVIPASAETLNALNGTGGYLTFTPPSSPFEGGWDNGEFYYSTEGIDEQITVSVSVLNADYKSKRTTDLTLADGDSFETYNGLTFKKHVTYETTGIKHNSIQFTYLDNLNYYIIGYNYYGDDANVHESMFYDLMNSVKIVDTESEAVSTPEPTVAPTPEPTPVPAATAAPSSSSSSTTTSTTTKDGNTTTTTTTTTTKTTPTTSSSSYSSSSDTIKIYVNGSRVYPDSDPVIKNDRTLVPIRVVAEALGYEVDWVAAEQAVDIHNDFAALYLIIGSSSINHYTYGASGEITSLDTLYADVPPQIINDRTYLPLRAVGEGLGAKVDWDGSTRSVYVTSGSVG